MKCQLLVQHAYDLDLFSLQMIHVSMAVLHVIISLGMACGEGSNVDIGSAPDDLADLLRTAPILSREFER
jgi:hypothetical protein